MTRGAGFGAGNRAPRRRRSGAAAFNPASTSPWAWYDPSNIATLFQSGTRAAPGAPVTASGDPVGLMLDNSGNNFDAVQATAAARPLYTVAGAVKYLLFDGVDDRLQATMTAITGSIIAGVVAGRASTGSGAFARFLCSYNNASGSSSGGATDHLHAFSNVDNTSFNPTHQSVAGPSIALAIDTDAVMFGDLDATNQRVKLDGGAFSSAAHGVVPALNADRIGIFADNAGGNPQKGRFHGGLVFNRLLTLAEANNLATWLGAKQGRTI